MVLPLSRYHKLLQKDSNAMYDNLPYRLGVGIMLLNTSGDVFVGKRIDTTSEAWQMPQGGIDDGEDPLVAAIREMAEEIGTDKAEVIAESSNWYDYDLPEDLITKLWSGRFRGQRQKWFCLRFVGNDSDINIATAHPEFCKWQWVKMQELPNLIVPFKRQLYQALVDEFRPYID